MPPVEVAINVLSMRMIYYPLMQAVTVLPASIYESLYGIHQADPNNNTQFAVDCIFAITAPSAGIGYLVIFLVMQPNAYKHFRTFFLRCKNYGDEETSIAPSSQSHLSSSVILHNAAGRGQITHDSSHVHSSGGSGLAGAMADERSHSSAQYLDRMRYMEEEELLSEIDSASQRSRGGDRDSTSSTTSRTATSPFWRTNRDLSTSSSIDNVM